MRKHQLALGVLAFMAAAAANASTFPEFKVDPRQFNQTSIPGFPTFGSIFTANQIAGNYNEVVTFDGMGGFTVSLRFNASSFNLVAISGTTSPGALTTGLNVAPTVPLPFFNGYGLYALLTGSGTVSAGATGPVLTLNAAGSSLRMFADDNNNTTFTNPLTGAVEYGRNNFADDVLLATGAVVSGQGTTKPCVTGPGQTDCGSFGQTTTFQLTPVGKSFFIDPAPQFYNFSFQSGVLNNNIPTGAGNRDFAGQLNVVFLANAVPEPAGLALVGAALLALGLVRRRKA